MLLRNIFPSILVSLNGKQNYDCNRLGETSVTDEEILGRVATTNNKNQLLDEKLMFNQLASSSNS